MPKKHKYLEGKVITVQSKHNLIELNGKLYDTATGKVMDKPATKRPAPSTGGRVMDGVMHKPTVAPTQITPTKAAKPTKSRSSAQIARAHTPQRAQTLARHAVKKPLHTPAIKSRNNFLGAKADVAATKSKPYTINKSAQISRFGNKSDVTVHKRTEIVPVALPPEEPTVLHHQPTTIKAARTHSASTKQTSSEKLVANAIRDAHSPHATDKHHRKHRVANKLGISPKLARFSAGIAAVLLIGGFIAYQNAPNVSMRIAASRAGINAQLPGYQPSGFAMSGPIQYGPGQVTVNFNSNSDQRNFHITQRTSDWNSTALLTNFVSQNHKAYQTYEDKGRTIYIYEGSNATWVNGGVWYQIEGNSSLNTDQLLNIATSI